MSFATVLPTKGIYRSGGKRLFDLVLSICVGLTLLPLIGPLMLLIRWRLGSPVFFHQVRAGLDGKPFDVVKFRSMTNAFNEWGSLLPDNQRMTPFGRFLRGSSLDELPQLWCVIRGDMSLVGPRPLLVEYVDRYSTEQKLRLAAMPGITGWAQINGRNAISWEERFSFDIWYVSHVSFLLDVRILLKTSLRLLMPRNINSANHATMPEFLGTRDDLINR